MQTRITYLTFNGRIPSRSADGIAVMNTCGGFAARSACVRLVLPYGQGDSPAASGSQVDPWDFYSLPRNFAIDYLRGLALDSRIGRMTYAARAVRRAPQGEHTLVYARQIEFACWAGRWKRRAIFESHNFLKVRQRALLTRWVRMIRNPGLSLGLITTTQAGARAYEACGVPAERILVAPNGVNPQRYAATAPKAEHRLALGLPSEATVAGYCGSLYPGRGIEELLLAAQSLPQLVFLIAGGEPQDVERCQEFARQHGLTNVRFMGFVSQNQVPRVLLAADILVMPYTTATLTHPYMSPMKLFDYLASGRPIVATDFPVLREILNDRENAVLVPPDSSQAIASGIKWCLDHPEVAAAIGEQARRDAARYSWDRRAARILDWSEQALNV